MASCVIMPVRSPLLETHEKTIKFGIDVDFSSLNTRIIFDSENCCVYFKALLSRFLANMQDGRDGCGRLEFGGFLDGRGFVGSRDHDLNVARRWTIEIFPNLATKLGQEFWEAGECMWFRLDGCCDWLRRCLCAC